MHQLCVCITPVRKWEEHLSTKVQINLAECSSQVLPRRGGTFKLLKIARQQPCSTEPRESILDDRRSATSVAWCNVCLQENNPVGVDDLHRPNFRFCNWQPVCYERDVSADRPKGLPVASTYGGVPPGAMESLRFIMARLLLNY